LKGCPILVLLNEIGYKPDREINPLLSILIE
jgi:hypothetical protein